MDDQRYLSAVEPTCKTDEPPIPVAAQLLSRELSGCVAPSDQWFGQGQGKQGSVAEQQGTQLSNGMTAAVLKSVMGSVIGDDVGLDVYQAYRDRVFREAGEPSDPIEQQLLEQLVLLHWHTQRLHVRAAEMTSLEGVKVLYTALIRMQAEYSKLALALQAYRHPRVPTAFIRQANFASGTQQVAYIEQPQKQPKRRLNHDTKLANKDSRQPARIADAKSQASRGRSGKCQKTPRANTRGQRQHPAK